MTDTDALDAGLLDMDRVLIVRDRLRRDWPMRSKRAVDYDKLRERHREGADVIDNLLAALRAERVRGEETWLPMKTAPKDGCFLVGWDHIPDQFALAHWKDGWLYSDDGYVLWAPHWPLDKPPSKPPTHWRRIDPIALSQEKNDDRD